jgi:uroporphyrinogen-III synthase
VHFAFFVVNIILVSSPTPSFNGLRVLSFESRRRAEMAALISNYGGQPISAPALREVPIESNSEAIAFADALIRGEIDLVLLLTGVGTRALIALVDKVRDRAAFVRALGRTRIAARGPKPVAALREINVTPWVVAPEPNTWRELLTAIDGKTSELRLQGARVAVQEYGASNPHLLDGLADRGAAVIRVPVYRYALPDDTNPLQHAARAVGDGLIDVALFTTSMQVVHLLDIARQHHLEHAVRRGFQSMAVASIGPTTSEELREQGITIDIEASHPRMGFLVRDAAERAGEILRLKRGGAAVG